MKRIAARFVEPALLTAFRISNPRATWDQFKNEPGSEVVFERLAIEQGHICAYCECRITRRAGQVEHFQPKSLDDGTQNLHLDGNNLLACCDGGTVPWRIDHADRPISETMHCGALKGDREPDGLVLNPRLIPATPCLWRVNSQGELLVDREACVEGGIDPALAESTLESLGLNRRSLVRLREAFVDELERQAFGDAGVVMTLVLLYVLPDEVGRLSQFWSTFRAWAGPGIEASIGLNAGGIPGLTD